MADLDDELEQPEGLPGDDAESAGTAEHEPAAEAAPEPTVPKSVFDAKDAELAATRRLADQALSRMPQAPAPPGFQTNPQYENDPYTQYMDARMRTQLGPVVQTLQQQMVQLASENDYLKSREKIDETYGRGTYKKLADPVESEFTANLQRGQPQSRELIFYALAGRQGMQLTPATERATRVVKTAVRNAKQGATVESGAPAAASRGRSDQPSKPLAQMSRDELKQSILNDPELRSGF
jgi:hypothetical protein